MSSQIGPQDVVNALRAVKDPNVGRDIVTMGYVKELEVGDNRVTFALQMPIPAGPARDHLMAQAHAAVEALGVAHVEIHLLAPAPAPAPGRALIPNVKYTIAVASGKGGVGKSTVAANLAVALRGVQNDTRVGLCDCDIYGPSIGLMFGTHERPNATEDGRIEPISRFNLKLMSMGFLLDDTSPAILRGPMVTRYTQQFLRSVDWGKLDYLVLDLPPGTGDIQLTIVQTVALSGAIIVTTPQEVALIDARKAATMFSKVNVPILGLVENMSYFVCPNDGNRYNIFGTGGGEREAARLQVPLLAQIPLEIDLRESGDKGLPILQGNPNGTISRLFHEIAQVIRTQCTI